MPTLATPTVAPVSTQPPMLTSPPTSSAVPSRDLEITITVSDRTAATFTATDKLNLIAATAAIAGVLSDLVKIELYKDVTAASSVGRRLDTTQVLEVKEYITASTVAAPNLNDVAALSSSSGMQIQGVTVIENPPPPPPPKNNTGLIVGISLGAVALLCIATGAFFWRRRRQSNIRAPPIKRNVPRDPSLTVIAESYMVAPLSATAVTAELMNESPPSRRAPPAG